MLFWGKVVSNTKYDWIRKYLPLRIIKCTKALSHTSIDYKLRRKKYILWIQYGVAGAFLVVSIFATSTTGLANSDGYQNETEANMVRAVGKYDINSRGDYEKILDVVYFTVGFVKMSTSWYRYCELDNIYEDFKLVDAIYFTVSFLQVSASRYRFL